MVTPAKPAVGGGVMSGPLTATLPTAADSTATGFTSLGYISDAGVTRSIQKDTTVVKAWGGAVVMILDNGKTETFKFVMLNGTDPNVLKLVNGDGNVTGSSLATGISAKSGSGLDPGHKFVIDMIESENTLHRICIPQGVVTNIGDVVYVDNAAVGYEVTLTAIADSAGFTCYEYWKTAASAAAS
ncbi:MAG: phage tail protein [Oscillospiraceae bacterium]|nr:phage tail protein [Oscillospiraceae bacterium]